VLVPSLSLVSTRLVGGGDCVESGSSRVDGVSIMLVQEGAHSKEVKGEDLEQVVSVFIKYLQDILKQKSRKSLVQRLQRQLPG
jgi:hypothetical protein